MVKLKVKTRDQTKKVLSKAKKGNIKSLGHAGAAVRLTARRRIRRSKKPAAEGSPPHTRRGQLKRAIAYAVEKDKGRVVIGPKQEIVGTSGKAHEFGGRYRDEQYEQRPFMGPALEKVQDRLPALWANSVR
jgi:hypothetical protein